MMRPTAALVAQQNHASLIAEKHSSTEDEKYDFLERRIGMYKNSSFAFAQANIVLSQHAQDFAEWFQHVTQKVGLPNIEKAIQDDDWLGMISIAVYEKNYIVMQLDSTPRFKDVPRPIQALYVHYQKNARCEAALICKAWNASTPGVLCAIYPNWPETTQPAEQPPLTPELAGKITKSLNWQLAMMLIGVKESAARAWAAEAQFWKRAEGFLWNAADLFAAQQRIEDLERRQKELKEEQQERAVDFPDLFEYTPAFFAERHQMTESNVRKHINTLQKRQGRLAIRKDENRWIFEKDVALKIEAYLVMNKRRKRKKPTEIIS